MTLGKLARRGLVGFSGGGLSGCGGTSLCLARASRVFRTKGECEPRALERRRSAEGADAARCGPRSGFRSEGEVMKVWGSLTMSAFS